MPRRRAQETKPQPAPARTLPQVNANAAGIDVGGTSHFVAVPADRAAEPVREFGPFTNDLYRVAEWLQACGIETVALESTGVYWIPLFQVLEERGFAVTLVDARQLKRVPGRKSDVLDCQWLQQLHTFELLAGAFLRRKAAHLGMPKAITATAYQLARIIYSLLANGSDFVDPGQDAYERAYAARVVRNLSRRASDLGYSLVKLDPPQALAPA